jgi:hypothetical protein
MPTQKDLAFINFLISETREQSIKWQPTAESDEFVVSFKGKYTAKIRRYSGPFENDRQFVFKLVDQADRELLTLEDDETDGKLRVLYNLAVRNSLEVDDAIDEIMSGDEPRPGPITDEDIPF